MKTRLIEIYLDWTNNWLTTSRMAESYGIEPDRLKRMHWKRAAQPEGLKKKRQSATIFGKTIFLSLELKTNFLKAQTLNKYTK